MKNKRIVLKLSGEILQGKKSFGLSDEVITELSQKLIDLNKEDFEIGLVIGAGNFFRGAAQAARNMNRVNADKIGMLGTVQNSIALNDKLSQLGAESVIFTALNFTSIGRVFDHEAARKTLQDKKIVIFAGGTGNPYFTTDTTAVLRALEVGAELVIKGTKVDGIYDKDPVQHDDAKFYKNISYEEYLDMNLEVMDLTAIALAKENQLPIKVFNIKDKNNISRAFKEKEFGSTISKY